MHITDWSRVTLVWTSLDCLEIQLSQEPLVPKTSVARTREAPGLGCLTSPADWAEA